MSYSCALSFDVLQHIHDSDGLPFVTLAHSTIPTLDTRRCYAVTKSSITRVNAAWDILARTALEPL